MGEAMRAVRGQRLLDLRPSQCEPPVLGQSHGMIGKEPEIVAVIWGDERTKELLGWRELLAV
jgi:hypothetical protein